MPTYTLDENTIKTAKNTKRLKVKSISSILSKKKYNIIRYDKDILSKELIPIIGRYRSVIVNDDEKVISFSPPKSLDASTFMKMYPCDEESSHNIVAQEFIEGTMINVFYNDGVWEIATKGTIGGNVRFFKNSKDTFRSMFNETLDYIGLTYDMLDKSYSYSFVLQHPKNRIVIPFENPKLYLIAIYNITSSSNETTITMMDIPQNLLDYVNVPTCYNMNMGYDELINTYASMNTCYNIVGIMFFNKQTGDRCKIRNPVYEEVRRLRGNQPKLNYHYLSLRKEGKVSDFLKYYPEYKKDFTTYRDQMHLFTQTIFQNYITCYMKKQKPLLEFDTRYRPHMFNLHKLYLEELKDKKEYITKAHTIAYVNELHPSQQLYWLNYNMRNQMVDTIKADSANTSCDCPIL
jgi:hypothetical protein